MDGGVAREGEIFPGWCGEGGAGREGGRCGAARQGAVGGIGWGGGFVAGGGIWVGVKGELSLASPPPEGGGLARDSLGRFFWRVGDEGWGCGGAAGFPLGRLRAGSFGGLWAGRVAGAGGTSGATVGGVGAGIGWAGCGDIGLSVHYRCTTGKPDARPQSARGTRIRFADSREG